MVSRVYIAVVLNFDITTGESELRRNYFGGAIMYRCIAKLNMVFSSVLVLNTRRQLNIINGLAQRSKFNVMSNFITCFDICGHCYVLVLIQILKIMLTSIKHINILVRSLTCTKSLSEFQCC
jgi:hypothetical protein